MNNGGGCGGRGGGSAGRRWTSQRWRRVVGVLLSIALCGGYALVSPSGYEQLRSEHAGRPSAVLAWRRSSVSAAAAGAGGGASSRPQPQPTGVCGGSSTSALPPAELAYLRRMYAPVITSAEKGALLDLMRQLDGALRASGVDYLAYGGTLLGSYRHRGLIPWDDDADVLVNFSDAQRLRTALRALPDHALHTAYPLRYKFYHVRGDPIRGRTWRWPFIDVSFYSANSTHIYDVDPELTNVWAWPPGEVFPAASAQYEGLTVPVPRNVSAFLRRTYNMSTCETRVWSHRDETYTPDELYIGVPCWKLHGVHTFYCETDHA